MARYTGAVCRQCRRENQKLFLKGDRCYSDKCALARRSFVPGQHGQNQARKKVSEYGLPELIAVAATAGLHVWKKNTLLSVGVGTVLYMLLVQLVFV